MARVFEKCSSNQDKAEMSALAYYVAAVSEKEREGMPLVGPSVDRRALTLACRLANSDTVCALSCFACAQLHTWVSSWEKQHPTQGSNPLLNGQRANFAYHSVADTLLRFRERKPAAFMLTFSLQNF